MKKSITKIIQSTPPNRQVVLRGYVKGKTTCIMALNQAFAVLEAEYPGNRKSPYVSEVWLCQNLFDENIIPDELMQRGRMWTARVKINNNVPEDYIILKSNIGKYSYIKLDPNSGSPSK